MATAPRNGSAPDYTVEIPSGGTLTLQDADEVDLWNTSSDRYIADYGFSRQNDLTLVGAILTQNVIMYRAQQLLLDPKQAGPAQERLIKAASEIRDLEKALGIDKKTREAGGQHTIQHYVTTMKRKGHARAVHLSKRYIAYEAFVMDLRWKLRVLRNGDQEDRAHHGITEKAILEWLEQQVAELEEADKKWAHEKGKIFVGVT